MGYHHSVLVSVVLSTSVNYIGANMKLFLFPCLLVVCHLAVLEALPMGGTELPGENQPVERASGHIVCENMPPPFVDRATFESAFAMCVLNKCTSDVQIGVEVYKKCEDDRDNKNTECKEWKECRDNFRYAKNPG